MANPFAFQPDQPVKTIGRVFGTPVKIQGWTWLPVNQVLLWGYFAWQSLQKHASWSLGQHLGLGGLRMVVFLGSEWFHNLAHVAAARAAGQPVDALRVIAGMPVLLYEQPEHPSITPRQHILRSLAGPLSSFWLLIMSKFFQLGTRPGSAAREVADTAVVMNTFIASAACLPVPVFDGGPTLKWSLIARGVSPARSEALIRRANQVIGPGLIGAAAAAASKRSWFLALVVGLLGVISLSVGFGRAEQAKPVPAQPLPHIVVEQR
jgi:hypothetical protein